MANITKPGSYIPPNTKVAVSAATAADSPGGKHVTEAEWHAIGAAVDFDLGSAAMLPIGAPYPHDASSTLTALAQVNFHENRVAFRTADAANDIMKTLASIGPESAKLVESWQAGNRTFNPADASVVAILKKVQDAVDKYKANAVQSAGGYEAAKKASMELSPKLSDKEGMQAINAAYADFKLGTK